MNARVAHLVAWYGPDSWGGTEQYVHGLVRARREQGVDDVVLVPTRLGDAGASMHRGDRVVRFRAQDVDAFSRALRDADVDVLHVHSWTSDCGRREIEAAHAMRTPSVVTAHVPVITCPRGSLMRFGEVPCDGRIAERRCAACWMQGRGIPKLFARTTAAIPAALTEAFAPFASARARHALTARRAMRGRLAELRAVADRVAAIVAPAHWLADALARNGVDGDRVVVSRQGVDIDWRSLVDTAGAVTRTRTLRALFVGRWSLEKGLPTILAALARTPLSVPLSLTICAPSAGDDEARAFAAAIRAAIAGDDRITVAEAVDRGGLASLMRSHDLLLAPSRWLETGPLTVLEALAAGVPVLGSDLGGIAEIVVPGRDGQLIDHRDPSRWADALVAYATGRRALPSVDRARHGRNMRDVASEMADCYAKALGKRSKERSP